MCGEFGELALSLCMYIYLYIYLIYRLGLNLNQRFDGRYIYIYHDACSVVGGGWTMKECTVHFLNRDLKMKGSELKETESLHADVQT